MSNAMVLMLLGALLVVVPMWISRWREHGVVKPGSLRDGVQVAMQQSDPMLRNFFSGLRIGIEIAGAIVFVIGALHAFGIST
jgi:hypothetical protein